MVTEDGQERKVIPTLRRKSRTEVLESAVGDKEPEDGSSGVRHTKQGMKGQSTLSSWTTQLRGRISENLSPSYSHQIAPPSRPLGSASAPTSIAPPLLPPTQPTRGLSIRHSTPPTDDPLIPTTRIPPTQPDNTPPPHRRPLGLIYSISRVWNSHRTRLR